VRGSEKRLYPGLRAPEDQRMHIMRALVGVDRFQVLRVAHDMVLDLNAVAIATIRKRLPIPNLTRAFRGARSLDDPLFIRRRPAKQDASDRSKAQFSPIIKRRCGGRGRSNVVATANFGAG
jgi:hypothetical protein